MFGYPDKITFVIHSPIDVVCNELKYILDVAELKSEDGVIKRRNDDGTMTIIIKIGRENRLFLSELVKAVEETYNLDVSGKIILLSELKEGMRR